MANFIDKTTLLRWIQKSLGTDNCTVDIEGTTEKGEGFAAELFFVKVELQEAVKILNLVVKVGKPDPEFRAKMPLIRDFYMRELYFYDQVIPNFKQLAKVKNVLEQFNIVPKCYKTFVDDNIEVIIMDNLKKQGYTLHPRHLPLNIPHVQMGLTKYAKLHAMSLAMQDQKKVSFEKLTENYCLHLKDMYVNMKPMIESQSLKLVNNFKEMGRQDLSAKYEKFIKEKSVYDRLMDTLADIPQENVIVHADCHNSNFMFKYEDTDTDSPSDMVLLDFQTSILHSPLLDVSGFLYINTSKKEFSQFDELMEFYYQELSSFVTKLGSDPSKLFPRSTMWNHWKRYSGYGVLLSATFMELLFVAKEDAPSMDGADFTQMFSDMKLKYKEQYNDRIVTIVEHYFNFNNIV